MPIRVFLPTPPPTSSGDAPEAVDESQFSPLQLAGQQLVDGSMEGLRGLASSIVPGVATPPSKAGRTGLLVGTGGQLAAPLMGKVLKSGAALEELMKLLEAPLPEKNAADIFLGERIGGSPAATPSYKLPEGVPDLKIKSKVGRDPNVVADRAARVSALKRAKAVSESRTPVQAVTSPDQLADLTLKPQQAEPPQLLNIARSGERRVVGRSSNKLNPDMVLEIRKLAKGATDIDTAKDIAKQFGVNSATIADILRGNSWGWVK